MSRLYLYKRGTKTTTSESSRNQRKSCRVGDGDDGVAIHVSKCITLLLVVLMQVLLFKVDSSSIMLMVLLLVVSTTTSFTTATSTTQATTTTSSSHYSCPLYVAPTMMDGTITETSKNSIFTLYNGDTTFYDKIKNTNQSTVIQRYHHVEMVVPLYVPNMNEFSPWHDYYWSNDVLPKEYTSISVSRYYHEVLISGLGQLVPCGRSPNDDDDEDDDEPLYNIQFDSPSTNAVVVVQQQQQTNNNKNHSMLYDSYSNIENYGFRTTNRGLKKGEQLFMNCDATSIDDDDDDSDNNENNNKGRIIRDITWLETYGACVGNIYVQSSTIPGIGRGAFVSYPIRTGEIITTSPLLHMDRSQIEIVQQTYKESSKDHKIPLHRQHNIEYQNTKVVGKQLLFNYVFGHPDSTLLLLPMAPGVNFINHANSQPNAYIRWSSKLYDTTSIRKDIPLMELLQAPVILSIEYVALRDLQQGEEIFIDYGPEWIQAWKEYTTMNNTTSIEPPPFRHEMGVPPDFYPRHWMRNDPNPEGDFLGGPLQPGEMSVIRWKNTSEVVTPWAFRIGLPTSVREVLLEYCNKMGITDIMRHVTVEGNELEPGTETHMDLEGDDWYLQRPARKWKSNLHWFSPGAAAAHEHYLQALSAAGFDKVLQEIGKQQKMDGLVAFHVTFIAVSHATKGFIHADVRNTNAKVYNIIIPLILANETGPELDLQGGMDDIEDPPLGRYRYEYDVASMMGDSAMHATSSCDYRPTKEMRMAATVYVADVNEVNIEKIMGYYTQAYPPEDIELLRNWTARHWKKMDPTKTLPLPPPDHILVRAARTTTTTNNNIEKNRLIEDEL